MDVNTEVFPIPTTTEDFFYDYLLLKKPVLETILSKLHQKHIVINPKVLKVFALLLYYNNEYRMHEDAIKWKLVFDYDTKMKIATQVKINPSQLNTYFSILRSYKLLTGKQISKPFIVYPEGGFELIFKFNIQ